MYKNKLRVLLLCISTLFFVEKTVCIGFWDRVGIAAAAVAGAVGVAKITEWCLTETNSQLLSRGQVEYNRAMHFVDVMSVYESKFNIYDHTLAYQYGLYRDMHESALYDIAGVLFHKGLSHTNYIADVSACAVQLKSLSDKLYARIKEQQGKNLYGNELVEFNSMVCLVKKIDSFLPRIKLFSAYLDYNKKYFSAYEYEGRVHKIYDKELGILLSGLQTSQIVYSLLDYVAWEYGGNKYPFTVFVNSVAGNIVTLKSHIRLISDYYPTRASFIRELADQLDWMRRVVVSNERYSHEVYQAEQERLEQLRIQAAQEQLRIERAQLSAMRERNRILKESNELERKRLSNNSSAIEKIVPEANLSVTITI